jgi:hypothetical protein
MVSDPVLGRILAVTVSGITEWNGFRWRQAYTLGGSLPAPSTKTIAVDPRTGDALVMVLANNGVAGSTWHYRELPAVPGTFGPHGAGCAGPLGVPSWVPPGDPPRLGRLLLCVLRNVPDGPQNITIVSAGTNAASWARQPLPLSLAPFGAPGCQVFVEPLVTVPRQAWLRLVAWEMPMPAGPAAIGARFYLQAATLVPGWNGLSTITSDAATGVIGTR